MIPYKIDNIPDTEVKPSSIHGRGLYATKDFSEGKVLGYLDGQYVPWDVYNGRGQLEDEWNAVAGGVMLRTFRTKYYFINHSRTPNLQVLRDPLRIVTRQAITAGQELSLDYREEPLPDDYLEGHGATYL